MRKIFLFAAALLTVGFANAQLSTSVGYLNTIVNDWDETYSAHGFNVELDYSYNLAGNLDVSSGLGMDMAFYKYNKNDSVFRDTFFDFSIPIDLSYGFQLNSNLKLDIFAGPTFMIGIKHIITGNGDYLEEYYDDSNYPLKRFNVLLGGGVSLDIKDKYLIKLGYKKGLLDLDKTGDLPFKKDYLTIAVGYIF